MHSENLRRQKWDWRRTSAVLGGCAGVGGVLGSAMDNVGAGIAIGISIGIAVGASLQRRKDSNRKQEQ